MAYHYAQIDEQGYVVGESWLSGIVSRDTMIPLSEDFSPMGKRYHRDTGEWEVLPVVEPELPEEDTTQDELSAELLLNQMEILSNQAAQDETLAEVLLAAMEG